MDWVWAPRTNSYEFAFDHIYTLTHFEFHRKWLTVSTKINKINIENIKKKTKQNKTNKNRRRTVNKNKERNNAQRIVYEKTINIRLSLQFITVFFFFLEKFALAHTHRSHRSIFCMHWTHWLPSGNFNALPSSLHSMVLFVVIACITWETVKHFSSLSTKLKWIRFDNVDSGQSDKSSKNATKNKKKKIKITNRHHWNEPAAIAYASLFYFVHPFRIEMCPSWIVSISVCFISKKCSLCMSIFWLGQNHQRNKNIKNRFGNAGHV